MQVSSNTKLSIWSSVYTNNCQQTLVISQKTRKSSTYFWCPTESCSSFRTCNPFFTKSKVCQHNVTLFKKRVVFKKKKKRTCSTCICINVCFVRIENQKSCCILTSASRRMFSGFKSLLKKNHCINSKQKSLTQKLQRHWLLFFSWKKLLSFLKTLCSNFSQDDFIQHFFLLSNLSHLNFCTTRVQLRNLPVHYIYGV